MFSLFSHSHATTTLPLPGGRRARVCPVPHPHEDRRHAVPAPAAALPPLPLPALLDALQGQGHGRLSRHERTCAADLRVRTVWEGIQVSTYL